MVLGRKNKRKKSAYYRRMKGDPRKMIERKYIRRDINEAGVGATDGKSALVGEQVGEQCLAPKRGEIWFVDLGTHPGTSVQEGCRPAVILSNDIGNTHSRIVTVLPMTSKKKRPGFPTHVALTPSDVKVSEGAYIDYSIVLAEQAVTVSKNALLNYVGMVSASRLRDIEKAVEVHLGLVQKTPQVV